MKKYKTILATPPWSKKQGDLKDIIDMSSFINKISEDDCHLYLWITNNFLEEGLKVMNSWGFRYITKITWFKKGKIGLGQYFRGVTEDCLFGIKGKLPYKVNNGVRQQGVTGFMSVRDKYGEKPEAMKHMIEKVSYAPYVELFAKPPKTDDIFKGSKKDVWDYIKKEKE